MSVLVCGGAGYIGSHTAVELLNSVKEIVIIYKQVIWMQFIKMQSFVRVI